MGRQTLGCKCCSSGIAAVWESPLSLDALSFSPVGASHPGGVSQHLRQSAQCGFGVTLDARASTQQSGGRNLAHSSLSQASSWPVSGWWASQPDSWGPACPASVSA